MFIYVITLSTCYWEWKWWIFQKTITRPWADNKAINCSSTQRETPPSGWSSAGLLNKLCTSSGKMDLKLTPSIRNMQDWQIPALGHEQTGSGVTNVRSKPSSLHLANVEKDKQQYAQSISAWSV